MQASYHLYEYSCVIYKYNADSGKLVTNTYVMQRYVVLYVLGKYFK